MASRRIKATLNNKYTQPLKLRMGRKLVLTLNCDYNSVLFTQAHRVSPTNDYQLRVLAKFAQDNFDGIHIKSYIEKDTEIMQSANHTFDIYTVATDSNWAETFVVSKAGTILPDGSFKCSVTASDFPPSISIDGELTLAIRTRCSRQNSKFAKKIYVNHLGIYDSVVRLRQDVEFLDITKLDE